MTLGQAGAVLAERYQLVRLVGTAIDGEIWQGQDQRLARSVTVRLAAVDPAATGQGGPDGEGGDEFDVQPLVARLSRINDPGVAAVYDVGVDGGLRYAVGEWIHGRTLGQIFATGRQPWQRAADWGQQVGAALSSLHGAGIVHGTMTAESIAIQDDRRTKIIDLGLVAHTADDGENPDFDETVVSRGLADSSDGSDSSDDADDARDADDTDTVISAAVDSGAGNTTELLPPVRESAPAEAADDVYALGAVLWWAVTGMPLAYATTTSAGPDPSPLREAGVPAEFTALLLRMLDGDPAARPTASNASEQFAAIQATPRPDETMVGPQLIAATQSIAPVEEPYQQYEPYEPAAKSSDNRRTWAIVLGVLALAAVGVLVGLLLANRSGNTPLGPANDTPVPTISGSSGSVVLPTAPTTAATTAVAPTTAAPTTAAPTTVAPTTVAPTTVAPTTVAPTTDAPTTATPTNGAGSPPPTGAVGQI